MGENFEQLRKTLAAGAPKGLTWDSAHYPDEDGLVPRAPRALRWSADIFSDWQVPRDEWASWAASSDCRAFPKAVGALWLPHSCAGNTMNNLGYNLWARRT